MNLCGVEILNAEKYLDFNVAFTKIFYNAIKLA